MCGAGFGVRAAGVGCLGEGDEVVGMGCEVLGYGGWGRGDCKVLEYGRDGGLGCL
jgi:hypothetical protein